MTVPREEFSRVVEDLSTRLHALTMKDTGVSVAVLSTQMTEVIKDVADLKTDLTLHRKEHVEEQKARTTRTRWAWGFAVAALSAVEGPLVYVLTHLHR